MTKFKEGDKVEVFQDGSTSTAWVGAKGIVKEVLSHGYRVELTDTAKSGDRVGYRAYLIGKNLKLIEETFKVGDRVEFIEHYMDGATTGTKATVVSTWSAFVDVETDAGKSFSPYARRLKLIEEMTFKVGDKVVVDKDYPSFYYYNTEAVVVEVRSGKYHRVKLTKLGPNATGVSVGEEHTLCNLTLLPPFTFKDIQKGDTIRRTLTRKSGAKEVREGTVSKLASWYAEDNGYILTYDTDTAEAEDVTLELLERPKPKFKAVWEDAKTGTVITRGDDHLILNDKGWLVLYSDGSTQQFEKHDAYMLVSHDSKVLAPTS